MGGARWRCAGFVLGTAPTAALAGLPVVTPGVMQVVTPGVTPVVTPVPVRPSLARDFLVYRSEYRDDLPHLARPGSADPPSRPLAEPKQA